MSMDAFNLAEQFQTPVFVNSDLDLGMNNWMADPFEYPTEPLNRGKVLDADDLNRLGGFARYDDVDGDAVGYRTLPGTNHARGAYFTRGSGHNEKAQYTERDEDYVRNMDRLARKFESIRAAVPKPERHDGSEGSIGILCCGTTRYAAEESRQELSDQFGVDCGYMRVKAFPFGEEITDFVDRHSRVYIVDQNRDAQLFTLVKIDLDPERIGKLRSVRYYSGLPIDARSITEDIARQEGL